MRGQPFRVAAAGLCMAFLWIAVATVSHLRTGGDVIARIHNKSTIAVESIAVSTEPAASGNAVSNTIPEERSASLIASSLTTDGAAAQTSDPESSERRAIDAAPPSNSIRVQTASQRRRRGFESLDPPPDIDQLEPLWVDVSAESLFDEAEPGAAGSVVVAELASLRRDFDRLVSQQQIARAQEAERLRRETVERETQQALAELQRSVQSLRLAQAEEIPPGPFAKPFPDASEETPPAEQTRSSPVPFEPQTPSTTEPQSKPLLIEPAKPSEVEREPRHPIAITPGREKGIFDFEIDGASLSAVLAAIGQVGEWNIVSGPEVQGTVTAVWQQVTPQQALDAVVAAHHLTVARQSKFLVVSVACPAAPVAAEPEARTTVVQLYRPKYISGRDLLPLIEPMLTSDVGRASVTLPASTQEAALLAGGGDSLAQADAVLVVDYPEVIELVTKTIDTIDVPAPHVELEATILDVQLGGRVQNGVGTILKSGGLNSGASCVPLEGVSDRCDVCCQTCDESCDQIIGKLRGWTDVRVVSNARLHVLNKQPAQLCVGEGYSWRLSKLGDKKADSTLASAEDATRLWVRPFVAANDLIRLDVAPEATSAFPVRTGGARQAFASVSTNVAIPNGGTLVIAGLTVEESLPAKASLLKPWERLRARGRGQRTEQRELVVMITARVVETCFSEPVTLDTPAVENLPTPP